MHPTELSLGLDWKTRKGFIYYKNAWTPIYNLSEQILEKVAQNNLKLILNLLDDMLERLKQPSLPGTKFNKQAFFDRLELHQAMWSLYAKQSKHSYFFADDKELRSILGKIPISRKKVTEIIFSSTFVVSLIEDGKLVQHPYARVAKEHPDILLSFLFEIQRQIEYSILNDLTQELTRTETSPPHHANSPLSPDLIERKVRIK